ncbi:MAG: zinc ribbon domain-containing protein [Clostridia bacterium]|nr:zinc ribbon domain-containing protein [Clostridia bacterium]
MAKYCNKCGAALRDDARFCESCGSKVPEAAPPRRFCSSCGKELPADAAFCRFCGAQVQNSARRSSRNDTPAGQTAVNRPAQTAVPPYREPVPQTQPAKTKPKKKGRGLSLFLSLAIVVEFCIAGFKYPGFLRKEGGWIENVIEGVSGGISGGGDSDGEADDALPLYYTKKQIDNAPAQSLGVSQREPAADFGRVRVEIDAWNLDEEDDTLTMRELPELSEGEEGWAVKAYDFSLASGQHEFVTDVMISIPRTYTDVLSGCVWFNEVSGEWEDVYYEVSEDGASYRVFADHFSLFGEKTYRFSADALAFVELDGPSVGLNDGVFVEVRKPDVNRMNWPVKVDYDRLWNLYQKKTEEDIRNLGNSIQAVMQHSDDIAASKAAYDKLDNIQDVFGDVSGAAGALGLPNDLAEGVLNMTEEADDLMGDFMDNLDILLTALKICEEAKRGNYTFGEVLKDLPKATMNHMDDIANIGVSTLAGIYLAPWAAALVGTTMWVTGKLSEMDLGNGKYTDPKLETIHQYFCTLRTTQMVYGDPITDKYTLEHYFDGQRNSKKKQTVPMQKPASMTEEDFKILKEIVQKNPLNRSLKGTYNTATGWYSHMTAKDEEAEVIYSKGWAEAFEAILTISADDGPEYLKTVLDEFYWSYAYAFWGLDEEYILNPICSRFWSTAKEGSYRTIKEVNDGKEVKDKDKIRCTTDFVNLLKQETKPILLGILEEMRRDSCTALKREMEKKLLPLLNCELTFHVVDENLPAGASFQNSMYCKDWTTINSNQYYVRNYADKGFDKKEFITPMRFDAAKEACFLPLLPSYKVTEEAGLLVKNSVKNYYPYTTDFIPRPEKKGDVVYRCTYYHYLMMGAPTVMFFKDVRKMSAAADEPEIPGKIVMPELTKSATRTIKEPYTGEKRRITEQIPIRKADVQVIVPRSVGTVFKFFDLNHYYFDSGSDAATMMLVYLEEALKTMEITLAADGSFSVTGSTLYENNTPRHDINDSIFPEVEVLYGEDVFDPVWEESGIYDSLHADLNGKVDLKSGTGSASLTANLSGSSYYRMGDTKGKVESSSTSTSASLEGVTPYVTVTDSGRELTIRFVSSGEDRLSFSYTTTHSSSPADSGKEDWDLTIVYRSVK